MFVKYPLPSIRSALMKSLEGHPREELLVQFVPGVCQNEGQCVLYCTIHLNVSLPSVGLSASSHWTQQPARQIVHQQNADGAIWSLSLQTSIQFQRFSLYFFAPLLLFLPAASWLAYWLHIHSNETTLGVRTLAVHWSKPAFVCNPPYGLFIIAILGRKPPPH